MLTVRRASERQVERESQLEAWSTFGHDLRAPHFAGGFFGLETLVELRLPPAAVLPASLAEDGDLVSYVHEGTIAFEDEAGRAGVVAVGEVHRQTGARGARLREANASAASWAHVFRMAVHADGSRHGPTSGPLLFTVAQRRNLVCVVASGDARAGSVRLHADAVVCSSILDRGHHLVHALDPGRAAWLHVVAGAVQVNGTIMTEGDGAGVIMERALSVTALETAEIFFIDVDGSTWRDADDGQDASI